MELSRKEIYKNQKISIGVTILSFIVMLLFLVFGKIATAAPAVSKENVSEVLLFMGETQAAQQQAAAPATAGSPKQAIVESIHQFINSGEEVLALKSMAGQIAKTYEAQRHAPVGTEPGETEYKPTGSGTKGTETGLVSIGPNLSFDLGNRSVVTMPGLENNTQEEGTVVVEITVNAEGKVIEANPNGRGTSTPSTHLKNKARQMALATRFNAERNAGEQKGTLTITFSF